METTRWQQIENLYHATLDHAPDARDAFLAGECAGDEALHTKVAALVSAHEEIGDFLSEPDFNLGLSLLNEKHTGLKAGKEIGGYEILGLLGRGGMGEVYLARDHRLRRRVALKLISECLTSGAHLVRRFRHEARAAAAISHPHIAHIYEFGEQDGQLYIAMEYVEGMTLRERLRRGAPLAAREALRIATQVAAALSAAHEAGIFHRDIKPENIMLRPDGHVKVLDFGLAKSSAPPLSTARETAETGTHDDTTRGLIIGTLRYMSPEQVRGQTLDARTDVWSLGVVLYEMLCGTPPFGGETNSDIIAEILKSETPEIVELYAPPAPALREVLTRALSKDPAARYANATAMHADLRGVPEELVAGDDGGQAAIRKTDLRRRDEGNSLLTTRRITATTERIKRAASTNSLVLLFIATLITALALAALYGVRRAFVPDSAIRNAPSASPHAPPIITRITHSGRAVATSLSADAKQLAYAVEEAGRQGIWVRQLDTNSTTEVVAPAPTNDFEGVGMAFSPDGELLYYGVYEDGSLQGTLYRVSVRGGAPERLASQIDSPVTFSPDGKQMVFLVVADDAEKLVRADSNGNAQQTIVRRTRPLLISHDGHPSWSPDGKTIAFAAGTSAGKRELHVMLYDVASGTERTLTVAPWHEIRQLGWLPDGAGLVMTAAEEGETTEHLYRVSYPQGEVTRLTNDLYDYAGVSIARRAAMMATVAAEETAQIWKLEMDETGAGEARARQISFGKNDRQGIAWTPDGRLVYGSDAAGNFDIWSMNDEGGDRRQLTREPAFDTDPDVSSDNRFVVFSSKRAGVYNLWRMNLDGGELMQLTNGTGEFYPHISPDNRWVVFHRLSAGDAISVWRVSTSGGAPEQLIAKPSTRATVSPDNLLVASIYRETLDAPRHIGIYPLAGAMGAPVKALKPESGAQLWVPPRWSPNGKSVVYVVGKDGVDNLWSQKTDGTPARQLTRFTADRIYSFDFAPDGTRIALARGRQNSYVVLLNGIR